MTREKAQRTFEKRLLAAERQGTLCNIYENAMLGVKMCHHARPAECWSAIYGLLFKAMRYGRQHGLIAVPDPWKDRSWMTPAPSPRPDKDTP